MDQHPAACDRGTPMCHDSSLEVQTAPQADPRAEHVSGRPATGVPQRNGEAGRRRASIVSPASSLEAGQQCTSLLRQGRQNYLAEAVEVLAVHAVSGLRHALQPPLGQKSCNLTLPSRRHMTGASPTDQKGWSRHGGKRSPPPRVRGQQHLRQNRAGHAHIEPVAPTEQQKRLRNESRPLTAGLKRRIMRGRRRWRSVLDDEPPDSARGVLRDQEGHVPAQRVTQQIDLFQPEVIEELKHVITHRRTGVIARSRAPTMTPQIQSNSASAPSGQARGEPVPRCARAAHTVQRHHRDIIISDSLSPAEPHLREGSCADADLGI